MSHDSLLSDAMSNWSKDLGWDGAYVWKVDIPGCLLRIFLGICLKGHQEKPSPDFSVPGPGVGVCRVGLGGVAHAPRAAGFGGPVGEALPPPQRGARGAGVAGR